MQPGIEVNMETLLVEIGAEEIPAGYIEPALNAFAAALLNKLDDARIDHGQAKVYGTPRRLIVEIKSVGAKQKSLSIDVMGPPKKIGFDGKGQPTVAALKFAEKIGVSPKDLKIKETGKGAYLYARKTEKGLAAKTILKTILPVVILSIPFPKTMKWADLEISFARPIQYVLALFGNQTVSFQVGNLKSGRYTNGHYFMHRGRIKISHADEYTGALKSAHVLVDIKERKKAVAREVAKAARQVGGQALPDEELLDTVTNLVEYPVASAGHFEDEFLELPREILITVMREHQKYFAVIDKNGDLMPNFIAVNNTRTRDMKLVATGHERVIRARLKDAQFFYRSDVEVPSDERVEKLKGVLFQAKLGTMHEKITRVQKLGEHLTTVSKQTKTLARQVSRAAYLCKADLVSQVVVEFPKLQGVMGRVYAAVSNEKGDVPAAIEEHYRPIYSGAPLPGTVAGAILGIADKMDSICGCFSVGLVPTGTSDPYALRRQGIGIVQIMLDKKLTFSLRGVIEKSITLFGKKSVKQTREIADNVYTFLANRISHLLAEEGFSKDVISSVVSVSVDCVPDVWHRVDALEKLKAKPDFEPLAVAFKRVVNIIKKAPKSDFVGVDRKRFQDKSESALQKAVLSVQKRVTRNLKQGQFDKALLDIASLRDPVDAFFDGVLVMAKEKKIRQNRLSLLKEIADLFANFADFSKISI